MEGRRTGRRQSSGTARTARAGRAVVSTAGASASAARTCDAAGRGTAAARSRSRAGAGRSAWTIRDVLRDQRRVRSAGTVLSLRVPAAAVSRLPAAGRLARWLLRAHEHERQPDLGHGRHAEARLRRRSREDAEGRAGHRAVPHRRERELPEQRRRRRQVAAPVGRAEHHDGRRRHAARQDPRGRSHLRMEVPRRLEGSVEDEADGTREDRGRALSLPVRRAAHQLRAAARYRTTTRLAGRQDHGARRLPEDRRSRIDRGRALGEHVSRRRRRPLVRVPGRQEPERDAVPAGHVRARQVLPLDGQPGHRPVRQHRHRLLVRRDAELRRPALRRPACQRSALDS